MVGTPRSAVGAWVADAEEVLRGRAKLDAHSGSPHGLRFVSREPQTRPVCLSHADEPPVPNAMAILFSMRSVAHLGAIFVRIPGDMLVGV